MANFTSITNRRQLLMAAGALVATRASGLDTGNFAEPDPAYLAYLHVVASESAVNKFGGDEDSEEYESLLDTFLASERQLASIPSTSPLGIRSKMARLAHDEGWSPHFGACMGSSILADLEVLIVSNPPPGSGIHW